VIETLIDSTTWVHKADTDSDGRVSEADYVLFKLQELQAVDTSVLDKLVTCYHNLDTSGDGALDIGIEIPSSEQVLEMQRFHDDVTDYESLTEMWGHIRAAQSLRKKNVVNYGNKYASVNECHDFARSRQLWAKEANRIGLIFGFLLVIYLGLAYYLLAYREGMSGVDGAYFLAATMTTVGFGDFAPTTQVSRGCAVLLLPCGLMVLSLVVCFFKAFANANYPASHNKALGQRVHAATALQSAWRGRLARKQHKTALTHTKRSYPGPKRGVIWWRFLRNRMLNAFASKLFRLTFVCISFIILNIGGALFFKLFPDESRALQLTWVDAFYFAVETSTTVGYGDIVPLSLAGKLFMIFYMVIASAVVVGFVYAFVDVYLTCFVGGRIQNVILQNITWVHKADINNFGRVSESEFILFKLLQLQRVDTALCDQLVDRYRALDLDGVGFLSIGDDIPSSSQVEGMQRQKSAYGTNKSLEDMWDERDNVPSESSLQSNMTEPEIRFHSSGTREPAPSGKIIRFDSVECESVSLNRRRRFPMH